MVWGQQFTEKWSGTAKTGSSRRIHEWVDDESPLLPAEFKLLNTNKQTKQTQLSQLKARICFTNQLGGHLLLLLVRPEKDV